VRNDCGLHQRHYYQKRDDQIESHDLQHATHRYHFPMHRAKG
jgi:hypothetical protein